MPENADGLPSNQIIEHRFKGFNLDVAPEKPNVYAHGESRKARETKLGTRTLYCEWHVKLEGIAIAFMFMRQYARAETGS
jgi:hypothetical protein